MITTIIDLIGSTALKYFDTKEQAAQFENEVTKTLLRNEEALTEAMAKTMSADSASSSWLTRNARPIVVANMVILLNVIVGSAVFAPGTTETIINALERVPLSVWTIIGGGIGLYSALRTFEKVKGVTR